MVLSPIFRVLHHVCSANVRWSTSSGSWVSGFLVEVQLLVESPQQLHPLAPCWGHCGHWASWTTMIDVLLLFYGIDDQGDDDFEFACGWFFMQHLWWQWWSQWRQWWFEMIMTLTEAGARFLQNIYDDNDDLVSGDVGERYVPMAMI